MPEQGAFGGNARPQPVHVREAAQSPRKAMGVVGALFLAELTGTFETAMIYAALGRMIAEFGDPARVGWLVTGYFLIGGAAAALAGRLGDIYGRRRVILLLLAAGIAGSLMSALAQDFAWLLAGRILQGLTGAVLPLCIGLLREALPPARMSMGVGLMISGASAGTAAGLVIGGLIVDHYSWHGIFIASAILSALSFLAILAFVAPSPRNMPDARIDWVGGLLFLPGVSGLLLVLSNGREWGWLEARSLGLAAVSVAVLGLWVIHALRRTEPLINVRLFRLRNVAVANIVTALVASGSLQITLVFSLLLQAPVWTGIGLGVSATAAGLAKLPSNLSSLFAGPLSGYLTPLRGGRFVMILGGLLCAGGWLLAMPFHGSVSAIVGILIIISFGSTMLFAVGPNIILESVPADRTSEAAGMMTVVRQTFLGVGAQLVSTLLATETVSRPGEPGRYPTPGAFLLTAGVIAALCLVAALFSLLLPHGGKRGRQG